MDDKREHWLEWALVVKGEHNLALAFCHFSPPNVLKRKKGDDMQKDKGAGFSVRDVK